MATDPSTGLTDQQQRFAREYLIDGNAAAAYQRAGYKAKPAAARRNASRLLTNAHIQAYLAQLRRETSEAAQVSLERVVEELGRVAFSNICDVMTWGQNGVTIKDSETLPPNVAAAVESVTDHESESGRRRTVKLHNKMAALGVLSDYFGIRSDFNIARATLKKYGLAMIEDPKSETGWILRPYES